jgi:peptidoglycan/LPS O-acetylase OafA/YrhL
MSDLRLLGVALTNLSVSDVLRQTRPWKRVGFVIMVTCGVLLAGAKLKSYYDNPYFQLKLFLLCLVGVHAMVFRRSVYGTPEKLDETKVMPPVAKAAASISLVLWLGIMSCGRWIAYFERPEEHPKRAPSSQVEPASPAR